MSSRHTNMFAPKAALTALVLLYDAHEAGAAVENLLSLKNQAAEAGKRDIRPGVPRPQVLNVYSPGVCSPEAVAASQV